MSLDEICRCQLANCTAIKIYDIDKRSRLDTVLSRFIQTHNHLFVVMDDETELGIITLEDVIEEILDQEIEDEYDEE